MPSVVRSTPPPAALLPPSLRAKPLPRQGKLSPRRDMGRRASRTLVLASMRRTHCTYGDLSEALGIDVRCIRRMLGIHDRSPAEQARWDEQVSRGEVLPDVMTPLDLGDLLAIAESGPGARRCVLDLLQRLQAHIQFGAHG